MAKISLKTKWISTDGWRGYEQPINACAGANDTGTWYDSPCPSDVATKELNAFKKRLRSEGIPFTEKVCQSSNVFCVHRYVVTMPEHRKRAAQIAKEMQSETRLLYPVND